MKGKQDNNKHVFSVVGPGVHAGHGDCSRDGESPNLHTGEDSRL